MEDRFQGSLGQFVAQIDAACRRGENPDPAEWIRRWPDDSLRGEATQLVLTAICELRGYDLNWLAAQVTEPRLGLGKTERIELLRRVYADWVDTGGRPAWSEFLRFQLDPEELQLKSDSDRWFLGQVAPGNVRLEQRLGSGGFAVVYRGVSLADGTEMAIRTAKDSPGERGEINVRMLREEARLLERLKIAGIPRLLGLEEAPSGLLVLVELIDGQPWSEIPQSAVPIHEKLARLAQVARILDSVHQCGIIHGDLKIENILIRRDGVPYLLDFNVSRSDDPTQNSGRRVAGTLPMMSPEAMVGLVADVDLRQDIYALGAILFELVTGELLVNSEDREGALVKSILLGGVHPPQFPDDVPLDVRHIVECAISRESHTRFETAGDFAEACEFVAAGQSEKAEIPKNRPWLTAWRMGNSLGLLLSRLQNLDWLVRQVGDVPPDAPLPKELRDRLELTITITIALEHVQTLGGFLGLKLPASADADTLATLFYTARRIRGKDLDQLRGAIEGVRQWFQVTWSQVEDDLKHRAPSCFMLVSLATEMRLAPYSKTARSKWRGLAEAGPISAELWNDFAAACDRSVDAVDWPSQTTQLEHRIVRELRWGRSGGATPTLK